MQSENLDSFIEFLYSVEESAETFTADQLKKLQLIQTKVTDLVDRVNHSIQQPVPQIVQPQQPIAQVAVAVSERKVISFDDFSKNTNHK